MQVAGIVLALGYYLSMLILFGNCTARVLLWVKSKPPAETNVSKPSLKALVMAVFDMLTFRRLLIANDCLWVGEWAFHVSFVFVMLRHLRYFLNPVPQWVWELQRPGIIAGYILPISLIYILAVKFVVEKKKYFSSYNFLLLALILALSISGLLMKLIFHPDIVNIKIFIMGVVTFKFAAVPASVLFVFHFIAFLVLIFNLPTHIFAAPLTLISAREREEKFKRILHEK